MDSLLSVFDRLLHIGMDNPLLLIVIMLLLGYFIMLWFLVKQGGRAIILLTTYINNDKEVHKKLLHLAEETAELQKETNTLIKYKGVLE